MLSAGDIQAAMDRHSTVLMDPELQNGDLRRNKMGMPLGVTGSFAVVFKVGPWAVRVFQNQFPEIEDRYKKFSAHLEKNRLDCFVDFKYQQVGFKFRNEERAVLKMRWIEAKTLDIWVAERLGEGNTSAVQTLAERWIEMIRSLKAAGFAHGDLAHGNVLVESRGEEPHILLVDYDSMCVPALVGQVPREVGFPGYQHPFRLKGNAVRYDLEIDNFAALVVYLSLRALAADPGLRSRGSRDGLLLRGDDIKEPGKSEVFENLANSPDEAVRRLADLVAKAASGPFTDIPVFPDCLQELGILALPDDPERAVELLLDSFERAVQNRNIVAARDHLGQAAYHALFHPELLDKLMQAHDRALPLSAHRWHCPVCGELRDVSAGKCHRPQCPGPQPKDLFFSQLKEAEEHAREANEDAARTSFGAATAAVLGFADHFSRLVKRALRIDLATEPPRTLPKSPTEPRMRHCPLCGSVTSVEDKVCLQCGQRFTVAAAAVAQPTPPSKATRMICPFCGVLVLRAASSCESCRRDLSAVVATWSRRPPPDDKG